MKSACPQRRGVGQTESARKARASGPSRPHLSNRNSEVIRIPVSTYERTLSEEAARLSLCCLGESQQMNRDHIFFTERGVGGKAFALSRHRWTKVKVEEPFSSTFALLAGWKAGQTRENAVASVFEIPRPEAGCIKTPSFAEPITSWVTEAGANGDGQGTGLGPLVAIGCLGMPLLPPLPLP
jgi:hypothetical protein